MICSDFERANASSLKRFSSFKKRGRSIAHKCGLILQFLATLSCNSWQAVACGGLPEAQYVHPEIRFKNLVWGIKPRFSNPFRIASFFYPPGKTTRDSSSSSNNNSNNHTRVNQTWRTGGCRHEPQQEWPMHFFFSFCRSLFCLLGRMQVREK